MKILHTADWHIGKQLLKEDLVEDHRLFFKFLLKTIEDKQVDVVLVSGDIFDLANPSNQSKKLYLDVLGQMKKVRPNIKVIITAGNHDSISYLESSKQILSLLDIEVVGDLYDVVILPIEGQDGEKVAIVPIPFLHDRVLRQGTEMASDEERIEAVREGLFKVFESWSKKAKEEYVDYKIIGMGHLFAQGASISESERHIQIGNLAGVTAARFDGLFDYLALGHIHKPQKLTDRVRYAGSPIALSFSERKDQKTLVLLHVTKEGIEKEIIEIPKIRDLIKFSGTLDDVISKLLSFKNTALLTAFAELDVREENVDPSIVLNLKTIETTFESSEVKIVKSRISFTQQEVGLNKIATGGVLIEDLQPFDVFIKKLDGMKFNPEDRKQTIEAFHALLDDVQNADRE